MSDHAGTADMPRTAILLRARTSSLPAAAALALVGLLAACGTTDPTSDRSDPTGRSGHDEPAPPTNGHVVLPVSARPSWWTGAVRVVGGVVEADTTAVGATEAEARAAARDAAAVALASTRLSHVESVVASSAFATRSEDGLYEVAVESHRTLVRTATQIGRTTIARAEARPMADGNVQAWVRASAPASRVFPYDRLRALALTSPQPSSGEGRAAWVDAMTALARDYEGEREQALARLTWQRLIEEAEVPVAYRALAALYVEDGITAAARRTLGALLDRHGASMPARAQRDLTADIDRLALPDWLTLKAQLRESIARRVDRQALDLMHRDGTAGGAEDARWYRVGQRFQIGIFSATPRAVALLWLDADGLYWAPWEEAATLLRGEWNVSLQGDAAGTVTVYAIATPAAAIELPALLPIRRADVSQGDAAAVARFQRLLASLSVWQDSPSTHTAALRLTLR